ncbi:hypothetical protein LQ564_25685, partial [Massilia sp. G4R7]|nr:hypothetical protein [Massilia phyllostachyos]
MASNAALVGHLAGGAAIPLQLDVKARHPDGSVRHAVISAVLPALGAKQTVAMTLDRGAAGAAGAAGATTAGNVASLLGAGFSTSFNATINGVRYTASADELLKAAAPKAW